jgi:hypothetical protein
MKSAESCCEKWRKRGLSGVKSAFFEAKSGQKTEFAVTEKLLGKKLKPFISSKLQEIKRSKKDFHREGGWGYPDFEEKKKRKEAKKGTSNQGPGLRALELGWWS